MPYKMITTAEPDWFFVQTAKDPLSNPVIIRVAAWGLTEDDKVLGLGGMQLDWENTSSHSQIWPPIRELSGTYKHLKDFTPAELKELARVHPAAVI